MASLNIAGGLTKTQGYANNNNIDIKKSNYEKICDFNQKVYSIANDLAKTKIESESENCTQKQELDNKFKNYWNHDEDKSDDKKSSDHILKKLDILRQKLGKK